MKYFCLFILSTVMVICCKSTIPFNDLEPDSYPESILGTWSLENDKDFYPSLNFRKDSLAILGSHSDTIYIFRYVLNKDSILLDHYTGKKLTFLVTQLNPERLIFFPIIDKEVKAKKSYRKVNID